MNNVAETEQLTERKTEYSLTSDVTGFKNLFVNYYAIGRPGHGNPWWLVDAGLPGSGGAIIRQMEQLFGENNPPQGIILTHGHFDHVGGMPQLVKRWPKVRVYAHAHEIPFLTGETSYPLPDPAAARGGMARMSWLFPVRPIDLKGRIETISEGRDIMELPDWTIIHTPGHSPGHISLFRERDRTLIAGDAFVTTNQNTLTHAISQKPEVHASPAYLTINWRDEKKSVQKLVDLEPEAAGTGHGKPLFGQELRMQLERLLTNFEMEEIPANGHYVKYPVYYEDGRLRSVRPPESYQRAVTISSVVALAGLGAGVAWVVSRFTGLRSTVRDVVEDTGRKARQKIESRDGARATKVKKEPVVVKAPKIEEKPVVVKEPVYEERTVMVEEPVVERRPVMVEEPVIENRPVIEHEPIREERT